MKKYLLSLIFLSIPFLQGWAQEVQNVQANAEKNSVIIIYDLISDVQEQKFNIELRSSINNFTTPLQEVTGDVGPDQSPGIGKTITWAALKEQGNFSGSVTFEITAELTFSPLSITNPSEGASVKLGKPLDVKWQGGDRGRNLKMAILQGTTTVNEIQNVGSGGSYIWEVPKTLAKGDNYQIKLFDPTKPNDAAMSAQFQLKKTSILIYVIPGVVAAGVATALLCCNEKPPIINGCMDPCDPNCSNYNPSDPSCNPTVELAAPPLPPGGGN